MNSKWIIDLKKNFFELIRREKSLIIIYPFFHFNPSLELFKKYFNVSKFILFRDLSKFPMNLMGEFIRKYIRKEILNLIEKEIEFYKDTFSNKFFKYIILKKNESFKHILTKNKIQKQIFKKIFGLKDLQISRIQNNNPIFIQIPNNTRLDALHAPH